MAKFSDFEIRRLSGKETVPVDVRVLAATNRDLEAAIKHQQFREDLYYRLSVVVIHLPPLRQRKEDIPELVNYFLRKYAAGLGVTAPSIHVEAVSFLHTQNWPGNVRELENGASLASPCARNSTSSASTRRRTTPKHSQMVAGRIGPASPGRR